LRITSINPLQETVEGFLLPVRKVLTRGYRGFSIVSLLIEEKIYEERRDY